MRQPLSSEETDRERVVVYRGRWGRRGYVPAVSLAATLVAIVVVAVLGQRLPKAADVTATEGRPSTPATAPMVAAGSPFSSQAPEPGEATFTEVVPCGDGATMYIYATDESAVGDGTTFAITCDQSNDQVGASAVITCSISGPIPEAPASSPADQTEIRFDCSGQPPAGADSTADPDS
jgi:hypothetical protein